MIAHESLGFILNVFFPNVRTEEDLFENYTLLHYTLLGDLFSPPLAPDKYFIKKYKSQTNSKTMKSYNKLKHSIFERIF